MGRAPATRQVPAGPSVQGQGGHCGAVGEFGTKKRGGGWTRDLSLSFLITHHPVHWTPEREVSARAGTVPPLVTVKNRTMLTKC